VSPDHPADNSTARGLIPREGRARYAILHGYRAGFNQLVFPLHIHLDKTGEMAFAAPGKRIGDEDATSGCVQVYFHRIGTAIIRL